MNKKESIPNFINGIGVLNYTIETKSIGISEFYLPEIPNVITYTSGTRILAVWMVIWW